MLNVWQCLYNKTKSLNSILILFSRPPPDPQRRSVGNIFPPLSAKLFCHPHKWTHMTTLSPCSDQERQQCNLFQFLLQCTWSWRVGITGRVAVVTLTIATLKYFRQFGRKPQSEIQALTVLRIRLGRQVLSGGCGGETGGDSGCKYRDPWQVQVHLHIL